MVDNVEVEMLGQPHNDSAHHHEAPAGSQGGMPVLRIAIEEPRDAVDFRLTGRFSVMNDQGVAILKDVASSVKWRLKLRQFSPAKYGFYIVLGRFYDYREAQELEYQLIEKGIGNRIMIRGGKLFWDDKVVNDNTEYWVVIDELSSMAEAQAFAQQRLSGFQYQILREKIHEPYASFELFDSELEKLSEADNVIRILPESDEVMTYLFDSHQENEEQPRQPKHRSLIGPLEFRCNDEGKIVVICEMPLEQYVESVVATEVRPDLPAAVIQAQAIAVRSKAIASLGIRHPDDNFHLCASSHCQRFHGVVSAPEPIAKAVRETHGIVLHNGRLVVDAYYSLICGGHTETYSSLSPDTEPVPYPAVLCADDHALEAWNVNLTNDAEVRNWVLNEPDVYCNLSRQFPNNQLVSAIKPFRWQVHYDREELEEVISSKIGYSIGSLFDIIPIRRGVSGRIFEIEILGSLKNVLIAGEQNICHTLAPDRLVSSCFVIDRQFDEDGFPISFTFYGAGVGHGVGLCQAGSIALALQGKTYAEILSHYFRGIQIKKIY